MSQENCVNCKRVKEHLAAVLPFQVLEKIADKPLRIRGVAVTTGMSRNFNIYTPEELQAFASKLVNSPVYIEHVAVPNAVGKVIKTDWDGHNLWYEAEIYDDQTAEKIRKGLIQHVSVGADYEAIDVVDGKVPHGLHNAELSLVAVPGIPETNVMILERLDESWYRESFKGPLKERLKEQGDVVCVFCGAPADYLISVCQSCFDKFPAGTSVSPSAPRGEEKLNEEELMKLLESAEFVADFKRRVDALEKGVERFEKHLREAGLIAEAEWDTEYINNLPDDAFAYIEPGGQKDEQGKTVPRSLRHLPYKNAQGNLDAEHVRNALARLDQTEISAEAKAEALRKLCAAAGELKIESAVCNLKGEAEQLRAKLSETEGKLTEAEKTVEELRKQLPGGGLLKDPPKMMPVSEHLQFVDTVAGKLPSVAVERSWGFGAQRHCQELKGVILAERTRVKEKYGV